MLPGLIISNAVRVHPVPDGGSDSVSGPWPVPVPASGPLLNVLGGNQSVAVRRCGVTCMACAGEGYNALLLNFLYLFISTTVRLLFVQFMLR